MVIGEMETTLWSGSIIGTLGDKRRTKELTGKEEPDGRPVMEGH